MSLQAVFTRWIGSAARAAMKREHPFTIAVTGTVGKSTARQMIGGLLQAERRSKEVRVPFKNFNNELGVPLTILDRNAPGRSVAGWLSVLAKAALVRLGLVRTTAKTMVLEMGADHAGDLAYLTSIATPDIAVVTAVTPSDPSLAPVHLANYPSIEALAEEKATLVRALRSGGTAVLNADDPRVFAMRHLTQEHVITFGETDAADVRILGAQVKMEEENGFQIPAGLNVVVTQYGHRYDLFFPGVFGHPIAYAAAAAVGVASAMDLSQDFVRELPGYFRPMPGRTRIIPGIKRTTLLDDSYNSSPAAVLSALNDLAVLRLAPGQRRIACLGEMRELGPEAELLHRKIGFEAAKRGVDFLVCCGIFAAAMADGARAGGTSDERIKTFEDTPEAGLFLQNMIQPGDVILAKASEGTITTKGVRMERVIKELMAEPLRADELLVRQGSVWQRK